MARPTCWRSKTIEKPTLEDDQVLVKVRAASINPLDWHYMRGTPYLMRMESGFGAPANPRLGVDFAGMVESVGAGVTQFKPGDEVFGGKFGALAEYVAVTEDGSIAAKPTNLSFEQAAAVNIAALTALQALRDRAGLKPGQKVLINGASGGVGTFAVQIAKSLGAEVTGVCSTRNVELVRSLGADHVIDYTKEDFTRGGRQYDVVLDNVANRGVLEVRRVLKPQGKLHPDRRRRTRTPIRGSARSWRRSRRWSCPGSWTRTSPCSSRSAQRRGPRRRSPRLMQEGTVKPVDRPDLSAGRSRRGDALPRDRPCARQGHRHGRLNLVERAARLAIRLAG